MITCGQSFSISITPIAITSNSWFGDVPAVEPNAGTSMQSAGATARAEFGPSSILAGHSVVARGIIDRGMPAVRIDFRSWHNSDIPPWSLYVRCWAAERTSFARSEYFGF